MKRILVLALLVPSIGSAQPTAEPRSPSVEPKDPTTAFMLSFGTTAAGTGVFLLASGLRPSNGAQIFAGMGAVAALVGPTVGHAYAERTLNAGLAVRLASAGGMVLSLVVYGSPFPQGGFAGSPDATSDAGTIIFFASASAYLLGTIMEIATAPSAARERNHEHHLDATLTVAPIQARSGTAPGLALVGSF